MPAPRAASTPAIIASSGFMWPNKRSIRRSGATPSSFANAASNSALARLPGLQALEQRARLGVAEEALAHGLGREPLGLAEVRNDANTSVVSTPP